MLTPQTDLAIDKTDGDDVAVPGTEITYTITVRNHGPSNVVGAAVQDDLTNIFPDGATWTCVAAPSGTLTFLDDYVEGETLPGPQIVSGLLGAKSVAVEPGRRACLRHRPRRRLARGRSTSTAPPARWPSWSRYFDGVGGGRRPERRDRRPGLAGRQERLRRRAGGRRRRRLHPPGQPAAAGDLRRAHLPRDPAVAGRRRARRAGGPGDGCGRRHALRRRRQQQRDHRLRPQSGDRSPDLRRDAGGRRRQRRRARRRQLGRGQLRRRMGLRHRRERRRHRGLRPRPGYRRARLRAEQGRRRRRRWTVSPSRAASWSRRTT